MIMTRLPVMSKLTNGLAARPNLGEAPSAVGARLLEPPARVGRHALLVPDRAVRDDLDVRSSEPAELAQPALDLACEDAGVETPREGRQQPDRRDVAGDLDRLDDPHP